MMLTANFCHIGSSKVPHGMVSTELGKCIQISKIVESSERTLGPFCCPAIRFWLWEVLSSAFSVAQSEYAL